MCIRDRLYDLSIDQGESNNLFLKKPEIAIQMRNKLKVWINEVKAKMPEVNEVQITNKVKGGTFTNLNVSFTY